MIDRALGRRGGVRHCYGQKGYGQKGYGQKGHGQKGATFLIALGVGLLISGSSAHAQLLNPFSRYKGPTLSQGDRQAGEAAARKLLESDPATVGQAESWTGPQTGNSGTFTIRKVFERAGMPCRDVASEIGYKRPQRTQTFMLTACRTRNGEWKLAN